MVKTGNVVGFYKKVKSGSALFAVRLVRALDQRKEVTIPDAPRSPLCLICKARRDVLP
jgi:hypothetical protein